MESSGLHKAIQAYHYTLAHVPEASALMMAHLIDALHAVDDPLYAYNVFWSLPAKEQETGILDSTPSPWRLLYAKAVPAFPLITWWNKELVTLSLEALDRLVAEGLNYHSLANPTWDKTWLSHGAHYGEKGYRAQFTRTNPVTTYWKREGLTLPDLLHDDALPLMEKAVLSKASLSFNNDNSFFPRDPIDWRIWAAVVLHAPDRRLPLALSNEKTKKDTFAPRVLQALSPFFGRRATSHEAMALRRLRANMPTIRTLLQMNHQPSAADIARFAVFL